MYKSNKKKEFEFLGEKDTLMYQSIHFVYKLKPLKDKN